MTDPRDPVRDFLSRFPANLRPEGVNEVLPKQFEPFAQIYMVKDFYAERSKFYDMEPVPDATELDFIRGRGRRCFLVGGGKSIEYFDFGKLAAGLSPEDLVISINGGSCYFGSDIVFYSGGVTTALPAEYGGATVSTNGGLLNQYPSAHVPAPQLVVLPYFYDVTHPVNTGLTARLAEEFRTTLMNVEYSDLWAWKKSPRQQQVPYETFAKGIRKDRLFGVGADFGTMAICCALMWGARELDLVGFDGRFIEAHADGGDVGREAFFESMWAGDQEMYAVNFSDRLTRQQYDFFVAERNVINEALFGYLRRYCAETDVTLRFLTPSIHAAEGSYLEL